MIKRFKVKGIGARLTFWFFIIAMLPLIMVNIAIYFHMVNAMKLSIFKNLEAIRDLKVTEVNHWLEERIIDIRNVANDDDIRILGNIIEGKEEDNQQNIAIIEESRDLLKRYVQNYDDFYEIFIVSPFTKKILVSSNEKNEGHRVSRDSHFEGALQGSSLFIEDIHYSTTLNKPCMAFSLPVFSLTDSNHIIGILVVRVNIEASLYKLLSNSIGMRETGETLIVNKDVIVLNELRWHRNAPLNLKINAKAAVDASLGNTGILETSDYRGKKVLAAYTHIPRTTWGFIAKQDLKEVYTPINRLRRWMIAIFITTVFGVIIVAFRVSKSISSPIKALHKGSEIIGSGNLDHKVGTDSQDEIGELSRTFDLMIENLKTTNASWEDLNREITERKHLEKTLLEIEEHERRRIGHDLHDNLGQQLTAISFKTQGLENTLRKKMILEADDTARIIYLIEMSKEQVKSLSRGLSPMLQKDEYTLMVAMVNLATNSEGLFGIPCIVRCDKPVLIYNEAALIHLYRIAQEAITNAARHSRPGRIEINLNKENNRIILTIKDDGTGFDVSDQGKGMGLEIMRYRARIINASLDIQSDINKGTVVTCIFSDTRERETNITRKVKPPNGSYNII